eukprot:2243973-Rhodomonas_salina.1
MVLQQEARTVPDMRTRYAKTRADKVSQYAAAVPHAPGCPVQMRQCRAAEHHTVAHTALVPPLAYEAARLPSTTAPHPAPKA